MENDLEGSHKIIVSKCSISVRRCSCSGRSYLVMQYKSTTSATFVQESLLKI